MTFVVKPSRNPIVAAAFAGLRAAERAEKKRKPEPAAEPKPTKPQRAARKGKR
jgi:hypothetical protein